MAKLVIKCANCGKPVPTEKKQVGTMSMGKDKPTVRLPTAVTCSNCQHVHSAGTEVELIPQDTTGSTSKVDICGGQSEMVPKSSAVYIFINQVALNQKPYKNPLQKTCWGFFHLNLKERVQLILLYFNNGG